MKTIFLIVIIMGIKPFFIIGQDSTKAYKWWLNDGFGIDFLGLSAGANYNFSFKNNFYQIGFNYGGTIWEFGNATSAYNIGIGKRIAKKHYLLAGFIGPSLVIGKDGDLNNYTTLGVISNLQGIIKLFKYFGIGLDFYGNLNPKQSTGGMRVCINISNNK